MTSNADASPVPPRMTRAVPPPEELLVMVSRPAAAPATVGSNCTLGVAVWVGFSVTGIAPPTSENPVPVTVAALTVTGAVPVDVNVTDCVAGMLSSTLPNARLVALMLSVGPAAFSFKVNVALTVPTVALSVTVCAVVTAETVALNAAVVALAGTVTVAGTVTAVLLLERFTTRPPVAAGPVSVTAQASVPAPVKDAAEQERVLNVAGGV